MPNDIPPLERRETRRLARAPRASPAAPCAAAPTSVRKVAPERRLADPRGHDLPVDLLRLAVPGIAGTKGFGGGFPGAEIADFGEPVLREVYAETLREVAALEEALEAVAGCHRRVVLLHYAPLSDTIVGEPEGIWAFLGSGRLAAPIGAHRPDAVFHGHAHHGRAEGKIGAVPVYNVARHVTGEDFVVVPL